MLTLNNWMMVTVSLDLVSMQERVEKNGPRQENKFKGWNKRHGRDLQEEALNGVGTNVNHTYNYVIG